MLRKSLPTLLAFAALLLTGTGLFALAIDFAGHEKDVYLTDQTRPKLGRTRPAQGDVGVLPTTAFAADIRVPPARQRPRLQRRRPRLAPAGQRVPLQKSPTARIAGCRRNLNTSGANDIVVLDPVDPLSINTTYVFEVNDGGCATRTARPFEPRKIEFTTAAGAPAASFPVAFEKGRPLRRGGAERVHRAGDGAGRQALRRHVRRADSAVRDQARRHARSAADDHHGAGGQPRAAG